jgi:hypothetical protein
MVIDNGSTKGSPTQSHPSPTMINYLPNLAALVAPLVTWVWRVLFRDDDAGTVCDGRDRSSGPSDRSRMCRIAHGRHSQPHWQLLPKSCFRNPSIAYVLLPLASQTRLVLRLTPREMRHYRF